MSVFEIIGICVVFVGYLSMLVYLLALIRSENSKLNKIDFEPDGLEINKQNSKKEEKENEV